MFSTCERQKSSFNQKHLDGDLASRYLLGVRLLRLVVLVDHLFEAIRIAVKPSKLQKSIINCCSSETIKSSKHSKQISILNSYLILNLLERSTSYFFQIS